MLTLMDRLMSAFDPKRTSPSNGLPYCLAEAPIPINRFEHEQNLTHLRSMLARATNEEGRRRIVALIEEEEAKQVGGNPHENIRN
jgi:hypothetical protein